MPIINSVTHQQFTTTAPDQSLYRILSRVVWNLGGTSFNGMVRAIALQPDGKILVGGQFTSYNGTPISFFTRLYADGTEDTAFFTNLGAGFNNFVEAIAIQADGKILVGGFFAQFNGVTRNRLVRLNADGTEDTAFNNNLGTGFIYSTNYNPGHVETICIQSDGKILVGGYFRYVNDVFNSPSHLARLNADGTRDNTFGPNISFLNSTVFAIAVQSNGLIVIGGQFTLVHSGSSTQNRLGIAWLDSSGEQQSAPYVASRSAGTGTQVYAISEQSDGKILVSSNDTKRFARLNADGTGDTAFYTNMAAAFNNIVEAIAIQADGKILVGGQFTTFSSKTRNYLVRLNADGTEDTGFLASTTTNGSVSAIALQPDGRILVGGSFTTYNSVTQNRITRLYPSGQVSNTLPVATYTVSVPQFINKGTGFNNTLPAIALQLDGKILVGGNFTSYNGVSQNRITRLYTDGSLDADFSGTGFNSLVYAIAVQSDGKIVIGGQFTSYDGTPVNRFTVDGQEAFPSGLFFKPDGTKMYVIGTNGDAVDEYNLSPAWDFANAFYLQTKLVSAQETNPTGVFFKDDGTKMYVVGSIGDDVNEYDLSSAWNVSTAVFLQTFSVAAQETSPQDVFFKSDGTKMYSLGPADVDEYDLSSAWDVATASFLQVFSVIAQEYIARGLFFKPDGTKMYVVGQSSDAVHEYDLSSAWNVSSAAFLRSKSVAAQETDPTGLFFKPDGTKMYVVGSNNIYDDVVHGYDLSSAWDISSASYTPPLSCVTRLNADGTPDTGFSLGTYYDVDRDNSLVRTIALQPDGKILVGGDFRLYNLVTQNRITRLNTNGTRDTGFTIGTGFNGSVWAIAVQSDGKILVGGSFTSYDGVAQNYTARLNTDGTRDTGFTIGTGFNGSVYVIAVQPDGKILVGGQFTAYNGVTQNSITRLNADGTRDTGFSIGTGFQQSAQVGNPIISTIAIQPDGKILAGGQFNTYNGVTQNRVTRLNTDGTRDGGFNTGNGFSEFVPLTTFPRPAVNAIALQPDGKILMGGEFTSYNGDIFRNRIIMLNTDGSVPTTIDNHYITEDSPLNIVMTTSNVRDGSTLRWNIVGDSRDSLDPNTGTVTVSGNETLISTTTISNPVSGSVSMTIAKATGTVVAETNIISVA